MSIVINLYYKGENKNTIKFAKEMEERGICEKIRGSEVCLR